MSSYFSNAYAVTLLVVWCCVLDSVSLSSGTVMSGSSEGVGQWPPTTLHSIIRVGTARLLFSLGVPPLNRRQTGVCLSHHQLDRQSPCHVVIQLPMLQQLLAALIID